MIYHHSFGNHGLMKKIFSVCIVLTLVLSISIPTFAEDAGNSSESNSAQQPAQEITENTSAEAEVNDSQPADEQDAGQEKNVSGELTSEAEVQGAGNGDVDVYAGGNNGSGNSYSGAAAIYYLANPTGDPWTNATGAWAPETETSSTIAQIDTTGATWEDGYVGNEVHKEKNIKYNVASYITSWPDGSKGSTWTVKKDDSSTGSHFSDILDSIWDKYKASVAKDLGISVEQLQKSDITEITLTPRKISRDNGGTYPYHIDCALSIKSNAVFTAKFWVKDPGVSEYTQVDAKNYKIGTQVEKTSKVQIGSEKEVDGVTYVLDGWYAENAKGTAYGEKIADSEWSYSPIEAELADGTVNFYAHYSPKYTSVMIQKNVTGPLGDLTKYLHFEITVKNGERDLPFKMDNHDCTGTVSIDLKNGESKTLINVPVNATVTVTEDDYGTGKGGYTTSYVIDSANSASGRSATITRITASEADHRIIFTNNKDVTPDTGLHLTSLPYIIMLVFAAGGAIVFFRRRRHRI